MSSEMKNLDITDIGTERYFLGTSNGQPIDNFDETYEYKELDIKSKKEFIANYCEHPDIPKAEPKLGTINATINLFQTYFNHGESDEMIRADASGKKSSFTIVNAFRNDLIQLLTWRADDLRAKRKKYVIDITSEKREAHLRTLIRCIQTADDRIDPSNPIIELSDDDILLILIKMAWYLLHQDKVPADIHESWSTMVYHLKDVNIDTIIDAVKAIKVKPNESRFRSNTDPSELGLMKKRIGHFLQLLEGSKHIDQPEVQVGQPEVHVGQPEEKVDQPEVHVGGRSYKPLYNMAMNPVIDLIYRIYPSYSFVTDIMPIQSISSVERMIRICQSLSTQKQYGIYRITNVPFTLFTYIQRHILKKCRESDYTTLHGHQYILCLDGNLSFIKGNDNKIQKKERKAIKTYFRKGNVYIVHTDKTTFDLSDYMRDPYFVYDINYETITDATTTLRITPTDSFLNDEPVEFSRYLTVNKAGLVDCTYLELSLFHQLKHITLE